MILRAYMRFYFWLDRYLPANIMSRIYGHDIAYHCFDHFGQRWCVECKLEIDAYGNTENALTYCCFPDCGCDGARLCMAERGASSASFALNLEQKRH